MKHTKIIIAAVLALALTACSDTTTAEVSDLPDVTTTGTALTEAITTAEETTTTAEITTVSETEISETVPTAVTEVDENGIMTLKASQNTKYYECRFTDENIVTDPAEFEDQALLENAKKLLEESVICSDIRAEMDKEAEELGYMQTGEYNFECRFISAVASDFNGDGQKESVFLFTFIHNCNEAFFARDRMTSCVLFADSSGNISICDEEFSCLTELIELKYNGFSHLVINGGHNNMSSKAAFYSVNNSGFKREYSDGSITDYDTCVMDKFLLKMSSPQCHDWLVCWNDDIKAYVTIDAVYLDKDKSDEVIIELPIDGAFDPNADISVLGGKYYIACSPAESDEPTYYGEYSNGKFRTLPFFNTTYVLNDGEYTRLEYNGGYSLGVRPSIDLAYLENFDFDTAVNNIISIE